MEQLRTLKGRNPVRVTVGSDDLTANSRVEQGLHENVDDMCIGLITNNFAVVEVFDDTREKE